MSALRRLRRWLGAVHGVPVSAILAIAALGGIAWTATSLRPPTVAIHKADPQARTIDRDWLLGAAEAQPALVRDIRALRKSLDQETDYFQRFMIDQAIEAARLSCWRLSDRYNVAILTIPVGANAPSKLDSNRCN